jgi:hypothetical protein
MVEIDTPKSVSNRKQQLRSRIVALALAALAMGGCKSGSRSRTATPAPICPITSDFYATGCNAHDGPSEGEEASWIFGIRTQSTELETVRCQFASADCQGLIGYETSVYGFTMNGFSEHVSEAIRIDLAEEPRIDQAIVFSPSLIEYRNTYEPCGSRPWAKDEVKNLKECADYKTSDPEKQKMLLLKTDRKMILSDADSERDSDGYPTEMDEPGLQKR